ncbi:MULTISPECIES: hypothetical protein [unclassified Methylobacterium]|uniref:hypothetical protein n=1 Tax=unclassified Methylobacterium TaxID=2615210 RepID=UPI000CC4AE31|nr:MULTISPECIES: hypothetical protein [unclassified Methylobacterium]PIU05071.1 MAG: hypothetical protein COT56_16485 [Methylobacterium sp. CG09_land_8_20_14_0_10_71_15]PIU11861.1 MAG: hypothetical protein COT28_17840 [Methylobacterium sp. CG08_land_8_20_14_0_20_71_15]GBU19028.1 hypothetical protein AwMethylo_32430 [Methylobacterium sp.]
MSTQTYTFLTPKARLAAFSCARGDYQRDLLDGYNSWSGSDLKGTAARYGGKYSSSRSELIGRLKAHPELSAEETTGPRGRRVVVIMTKAERRRAGQKPPIEAATAILDRAAKAREAARRKAAREAARDARHLAEDLPSLMALAA